MTILYHHIDSSNASEYGVTREPPVADGNGFVFGRKADAAVSEPLVFEVDYPSQADVPHFVSETIPVFSNRLVETFRAAGVENFQTFPAVLRNPSVGVDWDGYAVFHEIGLLAAADLDRSNYRTLMEGERGVSLPLLEFTELVLDARKTRNVAMFRLAENPKTLLIHERVLAHIKEHGPPGGWGFEATGIEAI